MSLRSAYKNCCRFCLSRVLSFDSNQVSDEIRNQYFEAFNLQLKNNEEYSNLSCGRCVEDLKKIILIRHRFLENQRFLVEDCLPPEELEKDLEEHGEYFEEIGQIKEEEVVEVNSLAIDDFIGKLSEEQEEEELVKNETFDCVVVEVNNDLESVEYMSNEELIEYIGCEREQEELELEDHQQQESEQPVDSPEEILHSKDIEVLENSNRVISKVKRFQCIDCNTSFTTRQGLQIHRSYNHERKNVIECYLCDRTFRGKQFLDNHMKTKHAGEFDP